MRVSIVRALTCVAAREGESGSGKSALVCNWALGYVERYKTERLVITHYIGSTAQSTDLAGLLRRFANLTRA